MSTGLTKMVEETLPVVFEAGRAVAKLNSLLTAMAKQIEANKDEIQRVAKLAEP